MTDLKTTGLRTTGLEADYPKVSLIDADGRGYVWIGAEVDWRPPFLYGWMSRRKRRVLALMKSVKPKGAEVSVFRAWLVPPGRGRYLKDRPEVHVARYDAVLLLAFPTLAEARDWIDGAEAFLSEIRAVSKRVDHHVLTNARRIGPVDHDRDGIFLFNYFVADDRDVNLAIWEHTAGWFQHATGLDNSTLLIPEEASDYTVINHCRWDGPSDILPALIFRRDFRSFVLRSFELNKTAATPVLYRLA
ncbi:hypothetical protein [Pseudooceanicola sp.]|uniref:hypothetical protein n=1 Tax=Pseudooceanicola sp. TaxID=1914328 RepID=UPI0035C69BE2